MRELELRLGLVELGLRRDAALVELLDALLLALLLAQGGVGLGDARARAVALQRAALGIDREHPGALLGGAALVDQDLGDAPADLRGDLRPLLREQLAGRLDPVRDVDGGDALERHGRALGRLRGLVAAAGGEPEREAGDEKPARPHEIPSGARPLPASAGRTSPRSIAAIDVRTRFFDHA